MMEKIFLKIRYPNCGSYHCCKNLMRLRILIDFFFKRGQAGWEKGVDVNRKLET